MEQIIRYLIEEKQSTPVVAKLVARKLCKYSDIREEFILWMEKRTFDLPDPVSIEGYTAKGLHEIAAFLDAAGIYSFLVTLRDDPVQAKETIEKGFPRRTVR